MAESFPTDNYVTESFKTENYVTAYVPTDYDVTESVPIANTLFDLNSLSRYFGGRPKGTTDENKI